MASRDTTKRMTDETNDGTIRVSGYKLSGLSRINVLLGRNGVGKSQLLRAVDEGAVSSYAAKKYVSPERTGSLAYQWSIEQQATDNPGFLSHDRRRNQAVNFKAQSVFQFSRLETRVLREIASKKRSDLTYTFDRYIDQINGLLENIKMGPAVGQRAGIELRSKSSDEKLDPTVISSGESELIALAIECLAFEFDKNPDEQGLLLLDEPDVHLHPDLQTKLIDLVITLADKHNLTVLIATHSTPIVAALAEYAHGRVAFMAPGETQIHFEAPSKALRAILPIFGAHPLTRVYAQMPLLLVEGDDEARIWQQVVRSSQGKLRFHPCPCGGKGEMPSYEKQADGILRAVYDKAIGFSLRDGDGSLQELDDSGRIVRCRMKCRSSENLLLTNEVLKAANSDSETIRALLVQWLKERPSHEASELIPVVESPTFNRMQVNLKPVRNVLAAILSVSKPWEVLIGQAIAAMPLDEGAAAQEGSLAWALGVKFVNRALSGKDD